MANPKQDTVQHPRLWEIWQDWPGWGSLASVNHTTVGKRFVITGLCFFLLGGLLAMLLRTQLALPDQDIIDARAYAQLFTMHGTIMMFLFAIPVLEGLAMYLLPKMLGVRDLLYPRLSSLGYYCYLFGGLILISSLALDLAPDSGWFMYTPLSSGYAAGPGSDFWLLGVTFVEVSAVAAGVELTVSILRGRAPGMALHQMPVFCWYILGMALMIVFGFPPLILGSILLELERAAGWPFFAVEGGGDPLLWQHLFWLFGHPEVYIIFLPAAGVVATLVQTFAGRQLVGYRWVLLSVGLVVFLSFALWVHHMFTVGIPHVAQLFFSVASMLIAIPTAIQIFAWLATLWSGKRLTPSLPMLWVFGFLVIFVPGGLTGVMLALVPFNWQVHDTHFVVAHFHYVLVGGMLFPLFAGLYYWLPLMTGRLTSQTLGRWGYWLTFLGFNGTFLGMHFTGLLGMPRRVFTYPPDVGWSVLNLVSSISGFVMAAGVGLVLLDLLIHARFGRPAPRNPWQSDSLEWAMDMPPAPYNFASLPVVRDGHPLWREPDLPERLQAGEGVLAEPEPLGRETTVVSALQGRWQMIVTVPSNTFVPMALAILLAGLCLSLLSKQYGWAVFFTVLAWLATMRWSWQATPAPRAMPGKTEAVGLFEGPGLWGMQCAMLANGTLFASYLFSWGYLWLLSENWDAAAATTLPVLSALASVVLIAVAAGAAEWARLSANRALARFHAAQGPVQVSDQGLPLALGSAWLVLPGQARGALLLAIVAGSAAVAVLFGTARNVGLAPGASTHDAMLAVLGCYLILHLGMAISAAVLQLLRGWARPTGWRPTYELRVGAVLWRYLLGTTLIGAVACVLPSWLG